MEPHLILGIGELLWDMLPEGPQLGGAPANFAVMAGRLGDHAAILSRIGRDDLGRQAIDRLDPMPVETRYLEVDPAHETGRVTVSLSGGEPHYTIHEPAAWDFLELSDEWIGLAERAHAVCFGSLAQRSRQSRQTIQSLIAQCSSDCIRIFDVNLREPFYSTEVLEESIQLATVVKMNEGEAFKIPHLLGLNAEKAPDASAARPRAAPPGRGGSFLLSTAERLLSAFPSLELVAITRGAEGSLLVRREEWDDHRGYSVQLADGIGAGDAFTAALAHYMLRGADLATLNEAGNRWGGWTASQSGAMPALSDAVRDKIASAIENPPT